MNGEQPLVRIIDDEESIREALSFLLGNEGWKTIGYENADTFLPVSYTHLTLPTIA